MWQALRAEFAYSRPYLLGGFGIAVGVVVIVSVVFAVVGEEGPPDFAAAGIRGLFLIMAPMAVAFIAQGVRSEEQRTRLLLAASLTPQQIAFAAVLLPVVLFGVGALAAGLMLGVGYLLAGDLELETVHLVGFVGGQLFAYTQIGLLAQEAAAARGQRRQRASAVGWAVFAVAIVLLGILYLTLAQESLTWSHVIVGHLFVAAMTMVATVILFQGRTDFTR